MIETPVAHSSLPAGSVILDGVEPHAAPAITTTGLGRDFGKTRVLHDVTLSVAKGRVCALLGPNGAGKTTLLKLLMGLIEPAAQLLADMKAEPEHSWHKSIANFLKYDTTHEDLIRLIATGDDIKLQRDVLPAIQNHPIPERVQWLDVLLKSPDETVRTEAAAVKTYLDNLRTQPLPHRSELRK